MAAGKLHEIVRGNPITYPGQNLVNAAVLASAVGATLALVWFPAQVVFFVVIVVLSLALGVLFVLPIGGADMPTVIALLNPFAGLAAVAMGFVLENNVLG